MPARCFPARAAEIIQSERPTADSTCTRTKNFADPAAAQLAKARRRIGTIRAEGSKRSEGDRVRSAVSRAGPPRKRGLIVKELRMSNLPCWVEPYYDEP